MSNGDTFALNIAAFVQKTKANAELVVRKTLLDVARRVVELSPVGNPELWAMNQTALMNRDMYQIWRRKARMAKATSGQLKRKFPLASMKGYVGGRFRANWQYGVDNPPLTALYDPRDSSFPDASRTLAAIAASVNSTAVARNHFIVNNLPYAQRLEDGWSSQAPGGMVAITVIEYQIYINDAVRSLP